MFPISSDDVLETHLFLKSNDFDVIQVIQHKLTLNNFTPASKCSVLTKIDASDICTTDSGCTVIHNPNTCGATLLCSTSVTNTPDIFFVGYTHNSSKGYTPNLDKENTNIEVNNCTYRLSGIVYLKSHHCTTGAKCILLKNTLKRDGLPIMVYGIMEKQPLLV